jgi:dTMP kinase
MAAASGDTQPVRKIGQGAQLGYNCPLIVALEGPPLAGKSTLASRLAGLTPDVLTFPDHYDGVPINRRPAFDPGSTEAQVLAIREFLAVELERLRLLRGSPFRVCILDRSVESLRAHSHALDIIRGYSSKVALEEALMTVEHLVPDVVLYLDTPRQVLKQRLSTRANSKELLRYLDPRYLSNIEQHFLLLAEAQPNIHILPFGEYVDRIPETVSSFLRERGIQN